MNVSGIAPNTPPHPQTATTPQALATVLSPLLSQIKSKTPVVEDVMIKSAQYSMGAGLTLTKRLYNGVTDVLKMFVPPQLGKTIKHTLMWTAGLSAFSFILTGPFHFPALPAYALASLGFDMAWTFVNGVFRSSTPTQQPQSASQVPAHPLTK